jgi:hypothetical protein
MKTLWVVLLPEKGEDEKSWLWGVRMILPNGQPASWFRVAVSRETHHTTTELILPKIDANANVSYPYYRIDIQSTNVAAAIDEFCGGFAGGNGLMIMSRPAFEAFFKMHSGGLVPTKDSLCFSLLFEPLGGTLEKITPHLAPKEVEITAPVARSRQVIIGKPEIAQRRAGYSPVTAHAA